jgi:peptidoglycan hydrolase-like protein with peptidoglycan-binding domain
MDGISPIEAYLTGRLREDELLAEVDRVIGQGSETDRTVLLSDWRTKSGRIRAAETRRRLDAKVQPLTWFMPETSDAGGAEAPLEPGRSLQPGDVLAGRFIIEATIGSGGMGTVFKARDLRRDEAQDRNPYVAVKTLNTNVLQRDDSLKILQREARKAQSLSHPNIVRVYDFDRDGGTLFITMELLEGISVEEIIRTTGLAGTPLTRLLPILGQVVSALQFAHAEGIVHSDLKPANIIVTPGGRVKVIDFGIARAIPSANQQTGDRTTFDVQALGAMTPAYASPEMLEGRDPDPRDDVFALACIVYELLTGRHPFGRAPATMARAGNFSPQEPASLSPRQWRALQGGLHFDRSRRVASPERLLSELTAHGPARGGSARRNLAIVAAASLLGSAIVALGVYSISRIDFTRSGSLRDVGSADRVPPSAGAGQPSAQRLAEQRAADEAAQRLAEQRAADEAAQRLAEQKAADEAAQRLAEQKAADDAAQRLVEQKAADEAAQRLAEQKAAEAAAQTLAQQTAGQIGPSQIAEAQRLLASMGFGAGTADGKAGPRTQEMIRAFQLAIGAPPTGELTTELLVSLRGAAPPTAARAKSLFTLAAEARRANRPGDAIRLYGSALQLAPRDTDGLLALADLHRDRGDYDAARRAYETVQRAGGAGADAARERLAALPAVRETPAVEPAGEAPSSGADTGSAQSSLVISRPDVGAARPFDGVYAGLQQVTGFSSPSCSPSFSVTVTVRDNTLLFQKNFTAAVAADGSFRGTGSIGLPPMAQSLTGRIRDDAIEADTVNPFCRYHISLKKQG